MNDRFLHELRREPRPEFAGELRERLRRQGVAGADDAPRPHRLRLALAAAGVVVIAISAFTLPAVRASAQAFLDLFRVRNFTAVTVNDERMKQLRDGKIDLQSILAGDVEKLHEPGPPRVFQSPGEAMSLLGYLPKVPARLPSGMHADTVWVHGESASRLTLDMTKLRDVLQTLDIHDVIVPDQLNGQQVTVRVPLTVIQQFRSADRQAELIQSRGPEVELPQGADLAQLGEIGLRIVGVEPNEARRLAHAIDWRSTAVVPVPANAGAFREVDVRGHRGLMVSRVGTDNRGRHREGAIVFWSENDMVFALTSDVSNVDLLEMANSIQ